MTISFSGYSGGPMTELQWALTAHVTSRFESAADCAVTQPNTTVRSVSVAAGSATAYGVRVTSDAAVTQALTAPGAGGAWYLLAWRRTWSPTKSAALQVLAGPTTAGTVAPTAAPAALPAGFTSTAGTQADQPIAWVWVSSASTTLAIFDVRLLTTLAGGTPLAPTLDALTVAALTLREGALVASQPLAVAGGTLRGTSWRLTGGVMLPAEELRVDVPAAVAGVTALLAGSALVTAKGTLVVESLGLELVYGGPNGAAAWKARNALDTLTAAARAALDTGLLWVGYQVAESDTGNTYRWCGGTDGWVLWDMPRNGWVPFGYASGFSNTSGGNTRSLSWIIRQGHLEIAGIAFGTFGSGTYATVTAVTAGTKPPTAYLPNGTTSVNSRWACHGSGGRPCAGQIGSDGNVSLTWNNFGGSTAAPPWIDNGASIPYGANA